MVGTVRLQMALAALAVAAARGAPAEERSAGKAALHERMSMREKIERLRALEADEQDVLQSQMMFPERPQTAVPRNFLSTSRTQARVGGIPGMYGAMHNPAMEKLAMEKLLKPNRPVFRLRAPRNFPMMAAHVPSGFTRAPLIIPKSAPAPRHYPSLAGTISSGVPEKTISSEVPKEYRFSLTPLANRKLDPYFAEAHKPRLTEAHKPRLTIANLRTAAVALGIAVDGLSKTELRNKIAAVVAAAETVAK